MSTPLTIVVLAAGLGTRFGSRKQLAVLGPAGEVMLDYTLRDAADAGFTRAVVVVSADILDDARSHFARVPSRVPVELVVQPAPRGTADATMRATRGMTTPFAVANADDYYGKAAITTLAAALCEPSDTGAPPRAVVMAYPVRSTLSAAGGVSRAVCRTDARGRLLGIEEHTGVRRQEGRIVGDAGALDEHTLVSMNLWGFEPDAIAVLSPVVESFLSAADAERRELRLPDVVDLLVSERALDVVVLEATGDWIGITHPEDAAAARTRFAELTAVTIAAEFATTTRPVEAASLVHGHIHETFVVRCEGGARIVLQKLNGTVFHDLAGLAANWERITTRLARAATGRPRVAEPVATRRGGLLFTDGTGGSWRATRFVEGTRVLGVDAPLAELRAAARAFAELTRDLEGVGPLVETIPRFHDLARRRADLARAVAADAAGRRAASADLIITVERVADAVSGALGASGVDGLPVRVVHNDAKLDNVLVDDVSGAVVAIVDLDTVMAGTVLNDFGELARTAAVRGTEDEVDRHRATFATDRFAALAAGYLEGASAFLTDRERDGLALAGPLLAIENAVRFLTDHLDGDVYFRVHHPGHNEQRARAQVRVAEQMLERVDELRAIVAGTRRTTS